MTAIEAQPRTYTPADLLAMPDGKRYELVNGHLVERTVSGLSSAVGMELGSLIRNHCRADNPDWVFGADCGYQCFPGAPLKVRKPDVSFIRRDRLPVEQLAEGFITVAPDLAVEVVSPNDLAYDVEAKVQEYLEAGTRLVWVVYPPTRTVWIYRADGSMIGLRALDELSGEDVLPGFRCPVGALFPAATTTAQPPA